MENEEKVKRIEKNKKVVKSPKTLYILFRGFFIVFLMVAAIYFSYSRLINTSKDSNIRPPQVLGELIEINSELICSDIVPDYNNTGEIDPRDAESFKFYFYSVSLLADLNADGQITYLDADCFNKKAKDYIRPSQLIQYVEYPYIPYSTKLVGMVDLPITIPPEVDELTIFFGKKIKDEVPYNPAIIHARDIDKSDLEINDEGNHIFELDSMAFPNEALYVKTCERNTDNCSEVPYLFVGNSILIQPPYENEKISGTNVYFKAFLTGKVLKINLQIIEKDTGVPIFNKEILPVDKTLFSIETYFDSTQIPDGEYWLKTTYTPKGQERYGKLPESKQTIFIANAEVSDTSQDDASDQDETTDQEEKKDQEALPKTSNTNVNNTNVSGGTPEKTTEAKTTALLGITEPKQEAELYDLPAVKGIIQAGYDVQLYLDDELLETISPLQTGVLLNEFTYSLKNPLAPDVYSLKAKAVDKEGKESDFSKPVNFIIKIPEVTFIKPNEGKVYGIETFIANILGRIKFVEFYADLKDGLSNIRLGEANDVPNTDHWSLTFDTSNYLDGDYLIYARAKGLNNRYYESNKREYSFSNGQKIPEESKKIAETTVEETPETTEETQKVSTEETTKTETKDEVVVIAKDEKIEEEIKKKIIIKNEDPRLFGKLSPNRLKIFGVSNLQISEVENVIVFKGKGPPNTIVTLYIYTEPVIVSTKTDKDGNWSYALDKPLGDGIHRVYVTITDKTGKVLERGTPLTFFIRGARAISEDEYLRGDINLEKEGSKLLINYLIGAIIIVVLAIIILLYIRSKIKPSNQIHTK